jgi:flagellar hook-associated protein 2
MGLSSAGIGSNLPIDSIISQLMTVEQQPLTSLDNKVASFQAKLSAIGTVKSALSTFQTAVKGLSDIGKFQTLKATVGDPAVASVTAGVAANPGTYSLEVSKLAQAQRLASAGQASATAAIGAGKITFDLGTVSLGTRIDPVTGTSTGKFDPATGKYTGASFTSNGAGQKTVTIDPSNTSLSGIRDAINKAQVGVTASIVNDGSASPYRLVLTETATGKTNSLKISVSGDAGLEALLNHDPAGAQALSETVTAQNAEFKLDGIPVSSASNTPTNVLDGVSLNLTKTNVGAPTTIGIARDTAAVSASVTQFVTAYNQINKTLTDLSAYNATTKKGAVLNGDATVRGIQTQLRSLLSSPIGNGATGFSVLSDIGVSIKAGVMAVDEAKLKTAMDSNFNDIAALFAAVGKPTDSLVSFKSAGSKTVAGMYAVNVSQPATRGGIAGGAAAGLAITATNNTIQVTLDGRTVPVTLAIGDYDPDSLAREVQSKINSVQAFADAGSAVSVTQTDGVLTITSNRYGSASGVSLASDAGGDSLLGGAGEPIAGADIAGTIGNLPATGVGRVLAGAAGGATAGLSLQIDGTGPRGSVNYSQGFAYQLDKLVTSLLSDDSPLSARSKGIDASIKDLATNRERLTNRLAQTEKRYRTQFTALDVTISGMNSTSAYLAQQLAQLSNLR